ncbi:MAG: DUF350 domain-containing protein [Myxococcota bacterium]|nr:DUF350 domain-containing protein [Myxococcota bacterium]
MIVDDWHALGLGLAYVVLGVVILLVAKIVQNAVTPYRIDEELTKKDNAALGLSITGYFAGVIIIYLGAAVGDEIPVREISRGDLLKTVGIDALYALIGVAALNVGRVVVDKLVLYKFSTKKEIIEDRNVGTGAVEFGCYIATALTIAGAISGHGHWWSALAFFGLGQVTLILFGFFYQLITSYDIHEAIEKDNAAAGVAFGSGLIAIGIILFKATSGDFISWRENLTEYGVVAAVGFVVMLLLLKVTDSVFLPNTTLAKEIARDRNVAAAWIEGIVSIGMATVICFML